MFDHSFLQKLMLELYLLIAPQFDASHLTSSPVSVSKLTRAFYQESFEKKKKKKKKPKNSLFAIKHLKNRDKYAFLLEDDAYNNISKRNATHSHFHTFKCTL